MAQLKKVFVSFDFDNDKALKVFSIGQSKLLDSPFEVADWSMKEAAPQRSWRTKHEAGSIEQMWLSSWLVTQRTDHLVFSKR